MQNPPLLQKVNYHPCSQDVYSLSFKCLPLASVVMKSLERLVLQFLKSIIDPSLGMFYVLQHLDGIENYAWILFVDYGSVLNTIIPSKLSDNIQNVSVSQSMCLRILEFLFNIPHVVKIGGNLSSSLSLSTSTPQSCVLSPMLYSFFYI